MVERTGVTAAGTLVVGVVAVCLAVAVLGSAGEQALRFERAAVLQDGRWWRVLSGQFVHLGWGHLAGNLAAWLLLAWLAWRVPGPGRWCAAFAGGLAGTAIGLLLSPDVHWYVGLSGALHGVAAGAATLALPAAPRVAALSLLAVAAKLTWEVIVGPVPGTPMLPGGARVVTEAHLWGGLGGAFTALSMLAYAARSR